MQTTGKSGSCPSEDQDSFSEVSTEESNLSLSESLKISDYIWDQPATPETINDINRWRDEQQRSNIVSKSLNLADYIDDRHINDRPAKPETVRELADWANRQRESTRTRISTVLVVTFCSSLAGSFVLLGLAAFHPDADKSILKDLLQLVITPQVTLLGVALGFYFGAKDK